MIIDLPFMPERSVKPRNNGLTMIMDKGLSIREAEDLMQVASEHIDYMKLGFGTSVFTSGVKDKIRIFREAGVRVYLGGTLFEAYLVRDMFTEFRQLLRETSRAIDDPLFGEKKLGYGLINLRLALDRLDDHLWDYTSITQQGNPSSSGTGTAVLFGGFYINPYAPGFSLYPYGLLGGSSPYGLVPSLLDSTRYPYLQQPFYTGGFGLPGGQFI